VRRARNALLALFSHDAAGLLIAAVATASFWGVSWAVPDDLRGGVRALGLALGLLLAVASLRHLLILAKVRREVPPPGRMVDIGGYRVHVLAEGQARDGRPPVVWFAGGHAGGFAMHHLHRAFRGETRSILIDRPGTGWSDRDRGRWFGDDSQLSA
jgi:hypothetical protein